MTHHVFPIRHHGPGSARALVAALERLEPDCLLVEGPPEADALIEMVTDPHLVPPVALLVYAVDDPARAARYPFAHWSPEWVALRWAVERGVPARFMDLPISVRFRDESGPRVPVGADEGDALALLARAAGYGDPTSWWEHEVELRHDVGDLFDAVFEAMAALREPERGRFGVRVPLTGDPHVLWSARREAWMRKTVRAAVKTHQRVGVVCGAWHAPALAELGGVTADAQVLKGLRKARVQATWIPWTWARLSLRSGYGAGIAVPGWYAEVWRGHDGLSARWLSRAARVLRNAGIAAASADVIEAVRLADALSALRGRSGPGLHELRDAAVSVLGAGSPRALALVRDRLEVGAVIGRVPGHAPTVPLARDVRAKQRTLRLPPSPEMREVDLDLRKGKHRARSALLHQMGLLGVPWGQLRGSDSRGTFRERWALVWDPELDVRLVEANVWGNTTEAAAEALLVRRSGEARSLPELTGFLDGALVAELPGAVEAVLRALSDQAAVSTDIAHLMEALPPLARVSRYGDVRRTPAKRLRPVIDGLFERMAVGLPNACQSLADDAAGAMATRLHRVDDALGMLGRPDLLGAWVEVLDRLSAAAVHGRLRGLACRLLLERGHLDDEALVTRARLALSSAEPPTQVSAWLEGLVRGSGLLLLHLDGLWEALDRWLSGLDDRAFTVTLPLLRRAFADLQAGERRALGRKARGLSPERAERPATDEHRASRVIPVLLEILGAR